MEYRPNSNRMIESKDIVYFKAKKVIDSCKSEEHRKPCRKYIEQFKKVYGDITLYNRLIERYILKFR